MTDAEKILIARAISYGFERGRYRSGSGDATDFLCRREKAYAKAHFLAEAIDWKYEIAHFLACITAMERREKCGRS